ncbi:conserved phage C-terminal domain-containing protein [Cysteiniphilum halobium]|uniref:conserved phage C-terminal domain-containing protein n=1 Tax=Cysteiniphilum halobium TaxID=2219059 RepID=UPI003F8556E1
MRNPDKDNHLFWLQQPINFFQNPKLKKLRRIAGGDTFTIIYQKIMLLSVKTDGVIHFQQLEPTISEELALVMDEEIDNVSVTLKFMENHEMISKVTDSAFLIVGVPELIRRESESAARVRRHREIKKQTKTLQSNGAVTQGNESVTTHIQLQNNNNTLDTSNEVSLSGKPDDVNQKSYPYAEIVNHLNQKTGSNYQSTCKKTRELIRARFADGHDLQAFKRAVDNQVALWWNDFKMRPYLRPETLFGVKMDGYANANVTPEQIAAVQGGKSNGCPRTGLNNDNGRYDIPEGAYYVDAAERMGGE